MPKFDKDSYPYSVYNTDVGWVKVTYMPKNEDVLPHKLPTQLGTALATELNRQYHAERNGGSS